MSKFVKTVTLTILVSPMSSPVIHKALGSNRGFLRDQ